jgi:DNA-binding transcriptional ArsR family regulator
LLIQGRILHNSLIPNITEFNGDQLKKKTINTTNVNNLQRILARYLLELDIGDRIASIRNLAESFEVSIGSISTTLNQLEEVGCIKLSRRGRMGSYIEDHSLGALWTVAKTCPLIIGLTIPSNLKFEGLATALKSMLTNAGVETYMMFIRGSRTRLKALQNNRCHIIVTSCFAAESLLSKKETIVMELPPKSFVSGHRVFFTSTDSQNIQRKRVGIDYDSYDQAKLTEMEFEGQDVEFIRLTFIQINQLLANGKLDYAVWTEDDMKYRADTNVFDRDLSEHVKKIVKDRDTCAALVALSKDKAVHSVVKGAFDENELLRIQKMVLEGKILPEY